MVLKENDDLGTFFVCDACGFKNGYCQFKLQLTDWVA